MTINAIMDAIEKRIEVLNERHENAYQKMIQFRVKGDAVGEELQAIRMRETSNERRRLADMLAEGKRI